MVVRRRRLLRQRGAKETTSRRSVRTCIRRTLYIPVRRPTLPLSVRRGATIRSKGLCTPSMSVNLWGESPLWEVSIWNHEPKARAGGRPTVRRKLEARPARPRTGTAYKAQPEDEQAQHERSPTDLGQGKCRVCAGTAHAPYLGRPVRHRLGAMLLCEVSEGCLRYEARDACVAAGAANGNVRRSSGRSQQRPQ